jgi:hypothetical protein
MPTPLALHSSTLTAQMNTLLAPIVSAALLFGVSAFGQSPSKSPGPAYKLEGGQLKPLTNDEAFCGLVRQTVVERLSVCRPGVARTIGLEQRVCDELAASSARVCSAYAQTFLTEPSSKAQCINEEDRTIRCSAAILNPLVNAQVMPKKQWSDLMAITLPPAFCEDGSYFRQCFNVTAE